MNKAPLEVGKATRQATNLLRTGNAQAARDLFQQAANEEPSNLSVWLGLAFANAQLDNPEATLYAVDKALELEPHNLRALLFKGDHLAHTGYTRKALVFYRAALKASAADTDNIPPDILTGLKRAQACCQRFAGEYENYLMNRLTGGGYRAENCHPRFQQALDIIFGRSEVFYQQPTRFYYPGLAQTQFFDRREFPWISDLEASTPAIQSELLQVMQTKDSFSPYLVNSPDVVVFNDGGNLDNNDWGAFYFYSEGRLVVDNAKRCPETIIALNNAPIPQVGGSTPHALFSKLAGNTKIPPHHGLINTRLICHLPLIVPENCGALRCGSQVQHWEEGKAFVFDDTIEHEAWNDSNEDRVVLLFDIWRPDLEAEERELLSALLTAVGAYESEND